jgi:hypothetical protein
MHNHKHDHCQHEQVKFCAQCGVCHCLNCGKEWPETKIEYVPAVQTYPTLPSRPWFPNDHIWMNTSGVSPVVITATYTNGEQTPLEARDIDPNGLEAVLRGIRCSHA